MKEEKTAPKTEEKEENSAIKKIITCRMCG